MINKDNFEWAKKQACDKAYNDGHARGKSKGKEIGWDQAVKDCRSVNWWRRLFKQF